MPGIFAQFWSVVIPKEKVPLTVIQDGSSFMGRKMSFPNETPCGSVEGSTSSNSVENRNGLISAHSGASLAEEYHVSREGSGDRMEVYKVGDFIKTICPLK